MTGPPPPARGSSLLEAVVSLLILSMMLLGASRLVVEQSQLVAVARLDSLIWQFADSILEQRALVPLDRGSHGCSFDLARCEWPAELLEFRGAWPEGVTCPDCRLTLVLESLSGEALALAPVIRESVVVRWVDRGRLRQIAHARIRS